MSIVTRIQLFLESDLIWYCDECGKPFGRYPLIRDEELEDALEEFEEEFGSAVYCGTCGNLVSAILLIVFNSIS